MSEPRPVPGGNRDESDSSMSRAGSPADSFSTSAPMSPEPEAPKKVLRPSTRASDLNVNVHDFGRSAPVAAVTHSREVSWGPFTMNPLGSQLSTSLGDFQTRAASPSNRGTFELKAEARPISTSNSQPNKSTNKKSGQPCYHPPLPPLSATPDNTNTGKYSTDRPNSYGFEDDATIDKSAKAAWQERYASKIASQLAAWGECADWTELTFGRLKSLSRKGVPAHLRSQVWKYALHAENLVVDHQGYYGRVCMLLSQYPVKDEYRQPVEADLRRALPDHKFVRSQEGQEVLRRILLAFCVRRPIMGYVSPMNQLAAFVSIFYPEEEAFWVFSHLVETLLPPDYYGEGSVGTRVDSEVFAALLEERDRKVFSHCKRLGIDVATVVHPWLLVLFCTVLPVETVLRIWDILFVEGTKILFRVALALFKINRQRILAINNAEELLAFLNKMGKNVFDCDNFIYTALKRVGNMQRIQIIKLRTRLRSRLLASPDHEPRSASSSLSSPTKQIYCAFADINALAVLPDSLPSRMRVGSAVGSTVSLGLSAADRTRSLSGAKRVSYSSSFFPTSASFAGSEEQGIEMSPPSLREVETEPTLRQPGSSSSLATSSSSRLPST